jgi:hypothetical protein
VDLPVPPVTDANDPVRGKAIIDSGKYKPPPVPGRDGRIPETQKPITVRVTDATTKVVRVKDATDVTDVTNGVPVVDPLATMFNAAWLATQVFEPLQYAIPGIVPEGLGVLAAPPKTGKSWLVFDFALACALGGFALQTLEVDQREVLYLALEDGPRRLQSRCERIMGNQSAPAALHFITETTPLKILPMMNEFLSRYADSKPLIVLDTLGKARPPRLFGSDMYQSDYIIGGQLKAVIDQVPGSSLIAVHHTRKAAAADFVEQVSGTQGVAGSADFVLVLERQRQSDEAILSVTGRDIIEAAYALTTDGATWSLDGDSLMEAADAAEQRRETVDLAGRTIDVLTFVNQRQGADVRASDLKAIGIDAKQGRVYLNRLANTSRINRRARGVFTSVTSVMNVSPEEVF